MNLSPHFTLSELIRSDIALRRGLDNTPPESLMENAHELAAGLERIRHILGRPLLISSGYRAQRVNTLVGGSSGSQHCQFQAADFTAPAWGDPLDVARMLRDEWDAIRFDQLIYEGNWVHVSFAPQPRQSILTAKFDHGRVSYERGIA